MESMTYYEKIQNYVFTQSNKNCAGGIEGCIKNPNDVRCKTGVKLGEMRNGSHSFYASYLIVAFNFLLALKFE